MMMSAHEDTQWKFVHSEVSFSRIEVFLVARSVSDRFNDGQHYSSKNHVAFYTQDHVGTTTRERAGRLRLRVRLAELGRHGAERRRRFGRRARQPGRRSR